MATELVEATILRRNDYITPLWLWRYIYSYYMKILPPIPSPAPLSRSVILLFILCMALCPVRPHATSDIDTTKKFKPDLMILDPKKPVESAVINTKDTSGTSSDSADVAPAVFVLTLTADSARFISPKPRETLTGNTVVCEIEPLMPVDSVKLFVRHSHNRVDTLGTISSPPYRAVWNCASLPDQDPAHLQFGYILYAPGMVVISPTKPYHWALIRQRRAPHREIYRIRQQITHTEFSLDGSRTKWDRAHSGRIGSAGRNIGEFRLLWKGAKLHFTARVNDTSITPGDFVELHLDVYRERTDFPGMNQRSLRFGPLTRSMVFVGEYVEGRGYVRSDSLVQLFRDEMDWIPTVDPDGKGYTIEAAIPLSLLSGFEAPPKMIGFDVTVMNVDRVTRGGSMGDLFDEDEDELEVRSEELGVKNTQDSGAGAVDSSLLTPNLSLPRRVVKPVGAMIGRIEQDTSFYSWAGAERFMRYSPSSWGTARFNQAMAWVKAVFYLILAVALIITLMTIVQPFALRRSEMRDDRLMDEENYSPVTEAVIECVERQLTDANLGLKDVLKSVGKTEEEVAAALLKDLDSTFDKLLTFRRIKRSQGLMKVETLSIEEIADMCGFVDINEYKEKYKAQMQVDPEISRAAVLERIREDREAEEEDDD